MPRTARVAPGGMVFHVLNRAVGRMRLFGKDRDFEAFEEIIEKTLSPFCHFLTTSMRSNAHGRLAALSDFRRGSKVVAIIPRQPTIGMRRDGCRVELKLIQVIQCVDVIQFGG